MNITESPCGGSHELLVAGALVVTVEFGAYDSRPDPIRAAWGRLEARKGLELIYRERIKEAKK